MKPIIKDIAIYTVWIAAIAFVLFAVVNINLYSQRDKMEIKNLNRQLTECRLNRGNVEVMEVLKQLLSPLTIDGLRLAIEQHKQQKLRSIFKQRETQSNEN